MNRLKLWLFALVVIAAAAAATFVHSRTLGTEALRGIETRAQRAATLTTRAVASLARDATALAGIAARDAALAEAVKPPAPTAPLPRRRLRAAQPPAAPDPAAQDAAADRAAAAALGAAARELGIAPEAVQVLVATPAALEGRAAAAGDAGALLRAAAEGKAEHGFVRREGTLWAAAGSPIAGGAALVAFVPVDAGWSKELALHTGVDVTVVAPTASTLTTAPKADATAIVNAASAVPGVVVDVGRMDRVESGLPRAPRVPLLFVAAPAYRALAVPLPGVRGARVVLSVPTRPELASIAALQWWIFAGLATLLVLAVLFSVLVRTAEPAPMVPEALLAAAARVEAGDADARAPKLAGKLGTVASALNRALDDAAAARAAIPPPPPPEDLFAKAAKPPEAEPSAFEFPARAAAPAPAPELAPEPAPEPAAPAAAEPEAAPFAAAPAAEPAPQPEPEPAPSPAAVAAVPELLQAAARAAAPEPAAADDEQGHWQQVFQEFLRTRTECGEAAEGLTFERFRAKLASNRAALVAKYSCRTVRFQVYVKDGKAALKATPVR